MQCFAFGTAKLSVLFFYRRIFVSSSDVFGWLSLGMVGVVVIWTLGFFFAILFRCGTQFWALWAPLKFLLANCYGSTPMFQAFCISDVITDVLILAMPIYWVRDLLRMMAHIVRIADEHTTLQVTRLRLTPTKKLAVVGVFLLGAV